MLGAVNPAFGCHSIRRLPIAVRTNLVTLSPLSGGNGTRTALQQKKGLTTIAVSPFIVKECGKQDLNLHGLAATRPST